MIQVTKSIFDHFHPKIMEVPFSFPEFKKKTKKQTKKTNKVTECKKSQFIPLLFSWDTANLRFTWLKWHTHFQRCATLFSQSWFSWICIPTHISETRFFPDTGFVNFHYRPDAEKINDKIFQYFEKLEV